MAHQSMVYAAHGYRKTLNHTNSALRHSRRAGLKDYENNLIIDLEKDHPDDHQNTRRYGEWLVNKPQWFWIVDTGEQDVFSVEYNSG